MNAPTDNEAKGGREARVVCDLCPHRCALAEGRRGRCWIRVNRDGRIVAESNGRFSAVAVDPIEKKPLYHVLPGSRSLSLGVIGCNLSCRFCQNAEISAPTDDRLLGRRLSPEQVADLAVAQGCASVSFTYNEPIVTFEQTVETAKACRARGLRTVAVTAGFIEPGPRETFFGSMDAANIDLKSFSDDFYRRLCGARLQPVLDTIRYVHASTPCWLEVTTLIIPGENDRPDELAALIDWVGETLGPDTPLHFSAFYPHWKMTDHPPTPPAALARARAQAMCAGLHYVYTGNVRDPDGAMTFCPSCRHPVIRREGFFVTERAVGVDGRCAYCGARIAGVFE